MGILIYIRGADGWVGRQKEPVCLGPRMGLIAPAGGDRLLGTAALPGPGSETRGPSAGPSDGEERNLTQLEKAKVIIGLSGSDGCWYNCLQLEEVDSRYIISYQGVPLNSVKVWKYQMCLIYSQHWERSAESCRILLIVYLYVMFFLLLLLFTQKMNGWG